MAVHGCCLQAMFCTGYNLSSVLSLFMQGACQGPRHYNMAKISSMFTYVARPTGDEPTSGGMSFIQYYVVYDTFVLTQCKNAYLRMYFACLVSCEVCLFVVRWLCLAVT